MAEAEEGARETPQVAEKGRRVAGAGAAKAAVSKTAMAPPGLDAFPGGLNNMGIQAAGPLVAQVDARGLGA